MTFFYFIQNFYEVYICTGLKYISNISLFSNVSLFSSINIFDYAICMDIIPNNNPLKIDSKIATSATNNNILSIIINNYILENYFVICNNSDSVIYNNNIFTEFLSLFIYYIEIILISIQKIFYEYTTYFFDLFRWYIDYKILLDKTIINSNIIQDLYYNISLELLMDIQSENIKSLLLLLENNIINKDNYLYYDHYICLFKNYFKIFNENPYKVNLELLNLYKQYPRSNILSFGIDYDLNIIKNNKYLLSFFESNIMNENKLNKLNLYYNIFENVDNYKLSNLKNIDKDQKYYRNMMFWNINIKNNLYNEEIIDITTKYNKVILDKFKNSYKWFTKNFFETENFYNYNELYNMFGGYSYWWGWHQDAVYIHGKKGPGGAPLWDDYIKWKMSTKSKIIVTYKPIHIKKIKHGVRLYNYYPGKITKKLKMFHFDWDYTKKKKLKKFIIHGRRVWEIEKLFFKNFLLSEDLWVKKLYSTGGTKYYWDNIEYNKVKYKFDFKRENKNMQESLMYVRFGFNSPQMIYKKKSKLIEYWFSVVNENDEFLKHIGWKKSRIYEYIIGVLEYYYTLSSEIHEESMQGIRGFIMKQFILDFWMNKNSLLILNYVNNNTLSWDTFYTNIESVTEPLNLNYINKNIYGRHFFKKMDIFLVSKNELWSDLNLPKNLNLLLKKTYIENLIYVYQREEEPMISYIKYKRHQLIFLDIYNDLSDIFLDIYKDILEAYNILSAQIIQDLKNYLLKIKQIRFLKEYHEAYKDNYKYLLLLVVFFFYSLVCSFLIVLIKSFLPKNLTYGIKTFEKPKWYQTILLYIEPVNNKFGDNNIIGYIEKVTEHYNKMLEMMHLTNKLDLSYFKFKQLKHNVIPKNTEDLQKKFRNLRKNDVYLKRNFFDKEHQFIYSWENRFDKVFGQDFVKVRTLNKIDARKNKDLKKNYDIFFKTFIFEKNLEKWENNTKIRADLLLWAKYYGLFKGLLLYYRDLRLNHNRTIFWEDPTLDEESKITYYFVMPKLFFNIFFIVRFSIGALKLWDFNYWVKRWRQYVLYGMHARVSYKDLKGRLEKEWTLEWYKDQADYGAAMFYKDYTKLVKKFNDIKKTPVDQEAITNQKKRAIILNNILRLTFDKNRYASISSYISSMKKIEEERSINDFDSKFKDIRKRLILDVEKITPKQWAEQTVMHRYLEVVFKKKLALEQDEYADLKQSYTKRVRRDFDDDEKTVVMLDWEQEKHIKSIMEAKLAAVHYEKHLREFNFENKIIDPALDRKERVFFEAIADYNKDLLEEYAAVAEKEQEERLQDTNYERKSRKLYGILETHYLWYRWYTTMGGRLNFLLSQIIGIFVGWVENIEKIRKNEYSVESLFKIAFTDFSEFVYKMYWEYLIIWKRYKILTKFGISLIEILKFAVILTPILVYTGSLYLILLIYLIIKKINNFILTLNIKYKFNNFFISNTFILMWTILFRDLKTGNTIFDTIYLTFYKFCGWIQRNIYFIKGAFILGYRASGILGGLNKIIYLLNLKYKAFIEQYVSNWKFNIISEIKRIYILHKENFAIKMHIFLTIIDVKNVFIKLHWDIIRSLYNGIIQPIFKIDAKIFYKLYSQNIELLKRYYRQNLNSLSILFDLLRQITFFEFAILFLKKIFMLIILPFKFLINHQRWKYIINYKQGIQGFRNNPMYTIINNPKEKKDWRVQLHNLLMDNIISRKLQEIKLSKESLLEIFLIYKIDEVKWANKNTFQEHFWRTLYWDFRRFKEYSLTYLISLMKEIEEGYKTFELSIETKNWSFFERIKYAYHVNKFEKDINNRDEQKKISRNLFFYKKAKDRRKLVRIYFIKGIINFITYLLINKPLFTKINNMSVKKSNNFQLRHRFIKYKSIRINKTLHLTEYLANVPPQFWSLVILYDKYFRYLLRYNFETLRYPKDWVDKLEYSKEYKWRLAPPEHNYDIPFFTRRRIGADMNSYHFDSFAKNLATAPFDPMLRWAIFLLEYGFSVEDITYDSEEVWGDISLTHLMTFNKRLDAYQYEIRDYNRLLKGLSWFRLAENALEEDKTKHYADRYNLVSKNIILKNKNVLENVLERRRLKAAKTLHKALLRNKARTQEEKDAEAAEEQNKDYFYFKKKEFFDSLEIQHYFDWQDEVQFNSKVIEEKYFGTLDIENATFDAKLYEDFHNAHGLPVPLTYLAENIVLKSFDQTLEEIFYFLKFTIWKIMNNKKLKKKTAISYKNLYIKPSLFKRINNLEYKIKKTEIDKETKESKTFYEYKYDSLDWELTINDPMYGFIENNYFAIYFETGTLYTYQDKIKFNDYAKPFYKPENLFHGNETLLRWSNVIRERRIGFKDIKNMTWKSKKRKKKKMCITLAYINNIKWSWEQWLGYGDIEKESEILNKNIIILNEKFRLWNLKRAPIRVKLPIALNVKDEAFDFFKEKSNYASYMDHTYFLMSRSVNPLVQQSLTWWECKENLEKIFNKNITDLVFWIFRAGAFDPTVRKIRKDFANVLKNFSEHFNVFNKIYFMGMQSYSWDLIRYHEVWIGEDEFPFHKYFALKQMEFINHDPAVARIVEQVHNLGIDKYKPGNYVYFFKYQYKHRLLYHWYGLLSISSFIWFLKILFYNPGEYIASYYMLMMPLFLGIAFWFLRRHLSNPKDVSEGAELYLYKYHTSKARSQNEWGILRLEEWKLAREEIVAFYDAERRKKVFGSENPDVIVERSENWWRYHSHLNSENINYTYKHIQYFLTIIGVYIWSEYWKSHKFKYRNHWSLWEYYRHEEQMYLQLLEQGATAPTNYVERMWWDDSFLRIESGGNIYSRWYENIYKRRANKPLTELDYGYDWQKVKDVDMTMYYDSHTIVHLPSSYSDASWIDFCRYLTKYIPEDLKENRKWSKYDLHKKNINFKDYMEHANNLSFNDDSDVKQLHNWYGEGDLNIFQHLYYSIKDWWRDILIEQVLGIKYTKNYNPLQDWFDFQKLILDVYDYDLTTNQLTKFIFDAKLETAELVIQDLKRYRLKNSSAIKDSLLQQNEILLMKNNSFITGEPLNLKCLLSISENEKNLHIIYHNFVQYKIKRLDLLLNSEKEVLINILNISENNISEYNQKIQEIIDHKSEIELYSKQCEQYIINISKIITSDEKLEYKYNLLLNLWTEKKWIWWLLKDIFSDLSISEIFSIIIKFIMSIL